jgi:hypothetical protein
MIDVAKICITLDGVAPCLPYATLRDKEAAAGYIELLRKRGSPVESVCR